MSEYHDYDDSQAAWVEPADAPEVLPVQKGQAWLAWLLILAAVGFVVILPHVRPLIKETAASDGVQLVVLQLQVRWLLGWSPMLAGENDRDSLYRQVSAFNSGTIKQRLCFIVFAGDLRGPEEALKLLANLRTALREHDVQPTDDQERLIATLERLYQSYLHESWRPFNADSSDAIFLQKELGWFAKVALAPSRAPEEAKTILPRADVNADKQRTVFALVSVIIIVGGLFLLGVVGLIVLVAAALTGGIQSGMRLGSQHHRVYAETFALWMALFLVLQIVAALAAPPGWLWMSLGAGMLASLFVLVWPVLRGIPWGEVRQDVGLTAGHSPLLEPLFGIGTYAVSLPLLLVGVIGVLILMGIMAALDQFFQSGDQNPFQPVGGPAHPIIEVFAKPNWSARLQILFVAAVVAPIVEETMFRGVLYRHLREATGGLGTVLSFGASAFLVSFIFAVIHPQGIVAVPALMALALGFTIAREWRGTLIPSMVAHGINNGLLITFVMVALS